MVYIYNIYKFKYYMLNIYIINICLKITYIQFYKMPTKTKTREITITEDHGAFSIFRTKKLKKEE